MDVIEVGISKKIFYSFPEHQHGYWEILLNIQGHGQMTIADMSWPFKPDDIFIIPPYTLHGKASPDGFMDISIFIKDFKNVGGGAVMQFSDDESGNVRRVMEMAYDFSKKGMDENRAVLNVLGDLLYQILAGFYKKTRRSDQRLELIFEVMDKNISNTHFDLGLAIESTGYSRGYFRKMFKEHYGQSPVSYFNQMRIDHAKNQIAQYGGTRSIKDIALASGFEDPLYFSRIFKKYQGMSPTEYLHEIQVRDVGPIIIDTPQEYI